MKPMRLEFVECLPHADQAGAAAGRVEDDVGQPPAELLGELEAHRLLALDAVRLLERRDVEPAHALAPLGDAPAAVVDEPVHERDVGARQRDLAHVDLGRVGRAEHVGLDAGGRGVGGERRAGVAVRRHRHAGDAELLAHRDRERQPARLEGAGRQPALVLDEQPFRAGAPRAACSSTSGVATSPSRTTFSLLRTGRNSRYFQNPPSRAASSSFDTARLTPARSYLTSNGFPRATSHEPRRPDTSLR